jgi:hypothetical protein
MSCDNVSQDVSVHVERPEFDINPRHLAASWPELEAKLSLRGLF